MKNKILILFIIIALFLIVGLFFLNKIRKDSEDKITKIGLQKVLTFPEANSDGYLANPVNFTFHEDSIYISDTGRSLIHLFDLSGNFVRSIGGPGRGPAEFMMQNKIQNYNGNLVVFDQGNRRFFKIDIEDNTFLPHLFTDIYLPFSFAINKGKIFMYVPYPRSEMENLERLPLIKVYDFDDDLIAVDEFGEHLNFIPGMMPYTSISHLKFFRGNLYVQFLMYPLLQIYSSDGRLLESIDFDHPTLNYKKRVSDNYRSDVIQDTQSRRSKTLVGSFDINDLGLFFHIYDTDVLIIDHFNHELDFIRRYEKILLNKRYIVRDMKVRVTDDGEILFYVLNLNGYPKIDVFSLSD